MIRDKVKELTNGSGPRVENLHALHSLECLGPLTHHRVDGLLELL